MQNSATEVAQTELAKVRLRENPHMREGVAISVVRRRLPMVEVDGTTPLTGEHERVLKPKRPQRWIVWDPAKLSFKAG
jgi:hypothetical protein